LIECLKSCEEVVPGDALSCRDSDVFHGIILQSQLLVVVSGGLEYDKQMKREWYFRREDSYIVLSKEVSCDAYYTHV
jgi:hypothetical protein